MLLELKNVSVHYGKAEALRDVSIGVESGSVVALLGANGAGKTTILMAISGLKKLTSGEIWYQGNRIDGLPAHEIAKRGIAHVPEGRMVFGTLTVKENLKTGSYRINNKKEVDKNLEFVYSYFPILKERQSQRASSLSGGEQQMLATGRALMASPKLILMDEPSMGLSPFMVEGVRQIVYNINSTGVTIVLVEQNARMALRAAKYAYVLETGHVAMEGEGQKLVNDVYVKEKYLGGK